jgi:hypothetical protein
VRELDLVLPSPLRVLLLLEEPLDGRLMPETGLPALHPLLLLLPQLGSHGTLPTVLERVSGSEKTHNSIVELAYRGKLMVVVTCDRKS